MATISLLEPLTHALPKASGMAKSRREWLDVSRLLAAYAIVWLHTPRSAELASSTAIGRFAVPFFTFAAVFLVWQSARRSLTGSVTLYAWSRFWRLYVPFLAWTAIYLLFKGAKAIVAPGQPNDFPTASEALLLGGHYHLWFLPFIMVVSIIVFAVARRVPASRTPELTIGALAAVAGSWIAFTPPPVGGAVAELWWFALPSVCWGVTAATLYRHGGARWMDRSLTATAGLALAIAATAVVWRSGRDSLAENLAGVGFFLFALAPWNSPWITKVARLGPLAYGIYLSHLLFIKVCESGAAKLQLGATPTLDLAVFCIAAAGSTALAWTLSRHRVTRWLCG